MFPHDILWPRCPACSDSERLIFYLRISVVKNRDVEQSDAFLSWQIFKRFISFILLYHHFPSAVVTIFF